MTSGGVELPPSLFEAGKNCWKISNASRVAVLIEARDFFQAFAWAAERARKTISILSWDIDSRISLVPGGISLGDFFLQLVERHQDLHIYILTWDFSFVFADEREDRREAEKRFGRHPRIHFKFDETGPIFISQHQKNIVVDDHLAFCGGLDLTQRRWDTREHKIDEPERIDPTGHRYGPFHDVQMIAEGDVARDLSLLFNERWRACTGESLTLSPSAGSPNLWPEYLPPLLYRRPVAIARTFPEYKDRPAVQECQELFLDSIKSAKDSLFIENQYFTSKRIGDLLIRRLREEDPPEVLIVTRLHSSKWTEAISVSVLRARLLRRLKRYDKKDRLLVLCPFASKKRRILTNMHSKIMIVDDRLLRVGSANLCGRSMGLDTECDLAVEAESTDDREALRKLRSSLMAEHLGVPCEEVDREFAAGTPMNDVVRKLQMKSDRTLSICPNKARFVMEWLVPSSSLVDPESPRQFRRGLVRMSIYMLALVLIAINWREILEVADHKSISIAARSVSEQPLSPLTLTVFFVVMISLGIPLLPLVLIYALILPPLETFAYTMIGALLSASCVYELAKHYAKRSRHGLFARILESERVVQIQQILFHSGFWPVLLIRLVPAGPFWVQNFCMGAIGMKFPTFLFATFLGLLPGLLLISYLEEKASGWDGSKGLLLLAVLIFVFIGWGLQKGVRHVIERRGAYADSRQL